MNRKYKEYLDQDGKVFKVDQFKSVWRYGLKPDYFEYVNALKIIEAEGLNKEDYVEVVPYVEETQAVMSIQELKDQKLAELNNAYERQRNLFTFETIQGLTVKGGKEYLENVRSRLFLWERKGKEGVKPWLDVDDVPHELTYEEHLQLMEDMVVKGEADFAKLVCLENQVKGITEETKDMLKGILW